MKTLFGLTIVIAVIAIAAIGCCAAQQDNRAPFVGKWSGPAAAIYIEFFADGRFIQEAPGQTMSGTYEIVQEGKTKYLNLDFKIINEMYEVVSISGNLIELKEGGTPRQLRRIPKN